MGKKVKKLISDCVSQRDSSFRLFEESRIITEDSSKGSRDRNMELINKVTDYIYEAIIPGVTELIYLLRDKWIDEDDALSEEDSNVVMETFKDIDEFIKVCSKEFLHLKSISEYMLAMDYKELESLSNNTFDRDTVSSLTTIMGKMIKPMCSISRTRLHIIVMGKKKYGDGVAKK